jgi:predicted adenine nucleotide alpha hydrolase (AANH) superfamily ATPase
VKLLLHICCSNCAIYPVTELRARGENPTGFWFNPNIHPFQEYSARLESVRKLQELWLLDVIYGGEYGLVDFVRNVAGCERERCRHCYTSRLFETARAAAAGGFDAFSTTLLTSPYQNQGLIAEIGRSAAEANNVEFHFEDFRPGFRKAQAVARELGLYRQKYCGCVYSEMERFGK